MQNASTIFHNIWWLQTSLGRSNVRIFYFNIYLIHSPDNNASFYDLTYSFILYIEANMWISLERESKSKGNNSGKEIGICNFYSRSRSGSGSSSSNNSDNLPNSKRWFKVKINQSICNSQSWISIYFIRNSIGQRISFQSLHFYVEDRKWQNSTVEWLQTLKYPTDCTLLQMSVVKVHGSDKNCGLRSTVFGVL